MFGKYTLGAVVKLKHANTSHKSEIDERYKPIIKGKYGHVIGFDVKEYDTGFDVVIKVRWCTGEEHSMHTSWLEIV